jgi:hypothetical protein
MVHDTRLVASEGNRMTSAEITAVTRNLPVSSDIPLTLLRSNATASSFLTMPRKRDEMPTLRIIQHAIEAGQK